jgi:hypothetical protein
MFATYDVQWLYGDPWGWQSEYAAWSEKWPDRIVEFPTNSVRRIAPAIDRFRAAVAEAHLSHSGEADLRRHVLNARLRPAGRDDDGRGIYTLEKAGPGRFMDGCIASLLALEAAAQIVEPRELIPFAF